MGVAIVTDSTADLPPDLCEALNIHVVANIIVMNGRSLRDGQDIARSDFYQRLPAMTPLPTTATAAPGDYQELYEQLLQHGAEAVLSVHASSQLSGIVNSASSAARVFKEKVQVVDSQGVSLSLGFQVIAAAEAAQQGASLESLMALLEDIRPRARLIAMLDTLEYIRRSGRVSWARARLGNLLRIKPFVEVVKGQVQSLGEVRTRQKGIERLRSLLSSQGSLERLALLHTNAEEDALHMLASLEPGLRQQLSRPPLIVNVTTIIGTHVGPNGLGFAAVLKS